MRGFLRAVRTIARTYTLQTLRQPWRSASVIGTVALVVVVFSILMGLSQGYAALLARSGSPGTAILTTHGARSESQGAIALVELSPVLSLIKSRFGSAIVVSPEYQVVLSLPMIDGREGGAPLRGLDRQGMHLRSAFHVTKGRLPTEGAYEILAGEGAVRTFAGLGIGDRVKLAGAEWRIVGHFSIPASVFDTELWTSRTGFEALPQAHAPAVQSIRVSPLTADDRVALEKALAEELRNPLSVLDEQTFYLRQSGRIAKLIEAFAFPLVLIMGSGAVAATLNTMSFAMETRRREIFVLKLIGYPASALTLGFLIEALILSFAGAALGLGISAALISLTSGSFVGGDFARLAFSPELDPGAGLTALWLGTTLGVIASLAPCISAAFRPIAKPD